ncbi:hypothetical protein, partial [Candidatus Nitrotoga sp. HW29]|uniref:hypothetical protein n=1 Tax=Candidatus Nitrotoga sp. HW29 TaxID=2886963 RepID=UPI001EF37ED0
LKASDLKASDLKASDLKASDLKAKDLKGKGLKGKDLKGKDANMGAVPQLRAKAGYEPFTSVHYPASCNFIANGRYSVVRNAGLSFIASFGFAGG